MFFSPHTAVYVYQAGSQFEDIINQYMITGKGINPLNPGQSGMKATAMNVTVAGATLNARHMVMTAEMKSALAEEPQ